LKATPVTDEDLGCASAANQATNVSRVLTAIFSHNGFYDLNMNTKTNPVL
jgi:hypothetical protein